MANVPPALALGLYRVFGSVVVRPLAPFLLSYRVSRGKEDKSRLGERYGRASLPRPEGEVVWVHAASVGETNAVLPLIKKLTTAGRSVVFTTVTVTAAKIAETRLPTGAVHQYSPIDVRSWVRSFISHWRPGMAILVESELWPQAIMSLSEAGVPLVIVNGRLSSRSFEGWGRHRAVAEAMFSRVSLCLAQSDPDGERYRQLGVRSVAVTGNLKFDTPPPGADPKARAVLKAEIGNRPVWLAASTHPGEEEIVATAHRLLAERHPGLLTIIVPRHPERGSELAAELASRRLSVARRTLGDLVVPTTDVYLADTLGELGLFYRIAPVAFVGGSLIDHGGQNPIEPISLGAAILHGPHTHNFSEVYGILDERHPGGRITDVRELVEGVSALIGDAEERKRRVAEARAALSPLRGALDRTVTALMTASGDAEQPLAGAERLEPAGP
jgi:3-deoxy-D-manno-octulosonic-acid transferase